MLFLARGAKKCMFFFVLLESWWQIEGKKTATLSTVTYIQNCPIEKLYANFSQVYAFTVIIFLNTVIYSIQMNHNMQKTFYLLLVLLREREKKISHCLHVQTNVQFPMDFISITSSLSTKFPFSKIESKTDFSLAFFIISSVIVWPEFRNRHKIITNNYTNKFTWTFVVIVLASQFFKSFSVSYTRYSSVCFVHLFFSFSFRETCDWKILYVT